MPLLHRDIPFERPKPKLLWLPNGGAAFARPRGRLCPSQVSRRTWRRSSGRSWRSSMRRAPSRSTLQRLGSVPVDAWPGARLVAIRRFASFASSTPSTATSRRFETETQPPVPDHVPRRPSCTAPAPRCGAWISPPRCKRRSSGLVAGETLQVALGRAEAGLQGLSEEEVSQLVMGWFQVWVSSGLFCGVEV